MKRCLIMGAGEYCPSCPIQPLEGDLLIAADGGFQYLSDLGLKPDLLVADFDSLLTDIPADIPVMRFIPEKDDPDMALAINEGIRRGFTEFHIYGGVGGRADHTFANYQALISLARRGMRGYLYGDGVVTTAIANASLSLRALPSGYVSVFAADNRCDGVTIEGLKYTLSGASMFNDYTLGLSNELIGVPGRISVESGTLLIFCPADALV